jgi:hypothetical protein
LAATKLDWAEDRAVDKLVGLCDGTSAWRAGTLPMWRLLTGGALCGLALKLELLQLL